MIRLACGITQNYIERSAPFLESLEQNCNVPFTVFSVDFHGENMVYVDYSKLPQLPKKMLQAGGFTQFVDWSLDDIVLFTDADAVLQRPFSGEELDFFYELPKGSLAASYNLPNKDQTLLEESLCICPKKPRHEIDHLFPDLETMECRNFGFVAARLSDWVELYDKTCLLEPSCKACFDYPARVQFMSCYAAQTGGQMLIELPPYVHAHGHLGLKPGLVKDGGLWWQDGELVAFAHAL